MGCKQKLACENNKAQNFSNDNPAWTQEFGLYFMNYTLQKKK